MMKKQIITLFLLTLTTFSFSQASFSLMPNEITQGMSMDIEITGENFTFQTGTNLIYFKQGVDELSNNVYVDSPTSTINIPGVRFTASQASGFYNLRIEGSDGQTYLQDNVINVLEVQNEPVIKSISPNQSSQGSVVTVTITGEFTAFNGDGVNNNIQLKMGGKVIYPQNINVIDAETVEVEFKPSYYHSIGTYSLQLSNEIDGAITFENSFTLLEGDFPPAIISVSPDESYQGDVLSVEITTEHMTLAQGTSLVSLINNGSTIEEYCYVGENDNTITIHPAFNNTHNPGYYSLTITDPISQTVTRENAIFIRPEVEGAEIISISIDSGTQGESVIIRLTCNNSDFLATGVANEVYLVNGSQRINSSSVVPIDETTIDAEFSFNYSHPIGIFDVAVKNNLDGIFMLSNAFELLGGSNAPVIINVTPEIINVGQTLDVEITGENTDFTQGTTVLSLKQGEYEIPANYTVANSPTSLTANLTLDKDLSLGDYSLFIYNSELDFRVVLDRTLIRKSALKCASYVPTDISGVNDKVQICYPNPAINVVFLGRIYDLIEIFDLKGDKVKALRNANEINVSKLSSGIYMISLKMENDIKVEKLVVQ